jgi:hypothetical protein
MMITKCAELEMGRNSNPDNYKIAEAVIGQFALDFYRT